MDNQAIENKVKEMKRQYKAAWRAKNREHLRQYEKNYWERKAKEALEKEAAGNE